jgi:chromate transporter
VNDKTLLKMLLYFAPLSFSTFGGGVSVVVDMHRQIVGTYHWLSDAEFLQLFALSRLAPGPGTLLVSMIGWKVDGWAGALVASLAIFIPSSLLMYFLARIWARYRGAPWQKAVQAGLAPISVGMLLATSFALLQATAGGVAAWCVAGGVALAAGVTSINPLLILAGSTVAYVASVLAF